MDGGKSQSSQEGAEAPRAQKQLKIGHQGQGKGIDAQSAPSVWLPAPMLHGEPLLENTSMRNLGDGEGGYVANALGRTFLLPTDMEEFKNMRMQEVFLSAKRYLGMVRLLKSKTLSILAPRFSFTICLSRLAGYPGHL